MQRSATQSQVQTISNRLPVVTWGLVLLSVMLLIALARLQQLDPTVKREFEIRGESNNSSVRRVPAQRGIIYDRDGVPLAFNVLQYEIGISPNLVSDAERVAQELGVLLNMDELALYNRIVNPNNPQWELIERDVPASIGQAIDDKDMLGVVINPLSRRAYPQQELAGPLVGFVIEDNDNTRGALGIEAGYDDQLAGNPLDQTVSNIPFGTPQPDQFDTSISRGMNVVLTIDRDIQYWVEQELQEAVEEQNASGGTVIVMNPRNGDILAMASYPPFNPNNFSETPDLARIPAIMDTYEPGSTMKVLTIAAALDAEAITPQWTYNDAGRIEVGGRVTRNWDRNSYGTQDVTGLLVNSLNVGAVEVALALQPSAFYSAMNNFGLGKATGINLPGEQSGVMRVIGNQNWSEADFAANSYGQALTVTPIQMVTAFSAIANDGLMYQPRLVRQIIDGDEVINSEQTVLNRAISSESANTVTEMMVRVVEEGAPRARIEGYTIAGKTGTAQIGSALGYETGENSSITSFIGFFPADDPQVTVLVKLDRPDGYYGSSVAAPLFRDIAQRLILLMTIPNDETRRLLQAEGGVVNER